MQVQNCPIQKRPQRHREEFRRIENEPTTHHSWYRGYRSQNSGPRTFEYKNLSVSPIPADQWVRRTRQPASRPTLREVVSGPQASLKIGRASGRERVE